MASKKTKSEGQGASTALVWVEDGGIRKKLASALKRARTYYQKAQAEWEQYQNEFVPGYQEWMKRVEGDLPMRLASVQSQYQYRYMILTQTDELSFEYNIGPAEAFARVMDMMEHPEKYPQAKDIYDDGDSEDCEDDPFEGLDEELDDDSVSFEEEMDRELYDTLLQEGSPLSPLRQFVDQVLGMDSSAMSDEVLRQMRGRMRQDLERRYGWGTPSPEAAPQQLKKKFREIAKHLHPDSGGEFDETTHRLWLDVQKAYEQGDEAYLDVVLARIRLGNDDPNEQTCWDLQSAVAFYRGSLKSLRKTLTREKKSVAWQFGQMDTLEQTELAATIRAEIREDLEHAKQVAADVNEDFVSLEKDRRRFDPEVFRKEEWDLLKARIRRDPRDQSEGDDIAFDELDAFFFGSEPGSSRRDQGTFDFF